MNNEGEIVDVIMSINPPYTNMVFGGIKPIKFRKKVLNEMLNANELEKYSVE